MALAPDPSDKLDAAADGAFGGKPVNRRAGYGDRLEMALKFARKGACLSAGEGQLIVEHYEERLAEVEEERNQMESMYRHHVNVALFAIDTLNQSQAILAALREPSEAVVEAVFVEVIDWYPGAYNDRKSTEFSDEIISGLRAAVAAAKQEVSNDPR